jgi:hypothetical protein
MPVLPGAMAAERIWAIIFISSFASQRCMKVPAPPSAFK